MGRSRDWLVVVAATAAGLVVGLTVALLVSETYRASGAVILTRQGKAPGGDPGLAQAVVAAEDLLRSRAVVVSAAANLKLTKAPEALLDDVHVSGDPETSLIRIAVDGSSPEGARRLAQELAEVFTVLYNGRFGPETTASIWETPRAEPEPVSPDRAFDTGLGGAAGFAVGLALVALRRRPRAEPGAIPAAPEPTPAPMPPEPEPDPEPDLERERMLSQRLDAVTARELALARSAAKLALRERELTEREQTIPVEPEPVEPEPVEPEPVEPEPVPEPEPRPEPEPVVPQEPFVVPRAGAWLVADVERLLAEHGGAFPERRDELGFYLESFRDVALPGGGVPAGVEVVVEDVFADLIDHARAQTARASVSNSFPQEIERP